MKFDETKLAKDIQSEAKAVKISDEVAEVITAKIVAAVTKWATKRPAITEADLNQRIAKEAEKYSANLAYVYQNRGKII